MTIVATGSWSTGRAHSPTSVRSSDVRSRTGSRRAGRTEFATMRSAISASSDRVDPAPPSRACASAVDAPHPGDHQPGRPPHEASQEGSPDRIRGTGRDGLQPSRWCAARPSHRQGGTRACDWTPTTPGVALHPDGDGACGPSARVIPESPTRLATQVPGRHEMLEPRGRSETRFAELQVERALDRQ